MRILKQLGSCMADWLWFAVAAIKQDMSIVRDAKLCDSVLTSYLQPRRTTPSTHDVHSTMLYTAYKNASALYTNPQIKTTRLQYSPCIYT